MVDRGVQFEAEQQHYAVGPDVKHEYQQGSNGAVKLVVAGEFYDPDPEKIRQDDNQNGGDYRAYRDKGSLSGVFGPELEHKGNREQDHDDQENVLKGLQQRNVFAQIVSDLEFLEYNLQGNQGGYGKQQDENHDDGHAQSDHVLAEKAPSDNHVLGCFKPAEDGIQTIGSQKNRQDNPRGQ